MSDDPAIIRDSGLVTSGQGYYCEVFESYPGDERIRVKVYVDAYDFQSYAFVQRWDGDKWAEVISRGGAEFHHAAPSRYRPDQVKAEFLYELADELRLTAGVILGWIQ